MSKNIGLDDKQCLILVCICSTFFISKSSLLRMFIQLISFEYLKNVLLYLENKNQPNILFC